MEEPTYLEFCDEFSKKNLIVENQNSELTICIEDEQVYLNEDQFKQLKEWIAKQELNTY